MSLADLVQPSKQWETLINVLRQGDVPDVCDHQDFHACRNEESEKLTTELDALLPGPIERFEIPKGASDLRRLTIFSARDRLAYRCIVSPMVPVLDARLGTEVRSQRVRLKRQTWTFPARSPIHRKLRQDVLSSYKQDHFEGLVKLDVANFYPSVDLRELVQFLGKAGCPPPAIKALQRFLNPLHQLGSVSGLPVCPEPSAVLGTSFLHGVDDTLRNGPWRFFRWVDDYYVLGRTVSEAIEAIPVVREALADRGLELSEQKLGIYQGDEIVEFMTDAAKDSLAADSFRCRPGTGKQVSRVL